MSQGGEELRADKDGRGDERIGYRRPPLRTRFRPGQSGNPRGRPGGARNLSTVIAAALGEKVAVTENGRRRRITKLEAAIKPTGPPPAKPARPSCSWLSSRPMRPGRRKGTPSASARPMRSSWRSWRAGWGKKRHERFFDGGM